MAQLQNLDGSPLTWAELHARNEAWHAARETVELSRQPTCKRCRQGVHLRCSGSMAVVAGMRGQLHRRIPCPCECRAVVPALEVVA